VRLPVRQSCRGAVFINGRRHRACAVQTKSEPESLAGELRLWREATRIEDERRRARMVKRACERSRRRQTTSGCAPTMLPLPAMNVADYKVRDQPWRACDSNTRIRSPLALLSNSPHSPCDHAARCSLPLGEACGMSRTRFSLNDHHTMAPMRARLVKKPATKAKITICKLLTAKPPASMGNCARPYAYSTLEPYHIVGFGPLLMTIFSLVVNFSRISDQLVCARKSILLHCTKRQAAVAPCDDHII
jgi:hypothetical protein